MIVLLLILIVLILLFGAAVVRGALANILGAVIGSILLCAVVLWVGSFFGEDGPRYVIYALCAVGLVLAGAAAIYQANEKAEAQAAAAPPPAWTPSSSVKAEGIAVWRRWETEIDGKFSSQARARAQVFYDAGDPAGLDKFCREGSRRLRT